MVRDNTMMENMVERMPEIKCSMLRVIGDVDLKTLAEVGILTLNYDYLCHSGRLLRIRIPSIHSIYYTSFHFKKNIFQLAHPVPLGPLR